MTCSMFLLWHGFKYIFYVFIMVTNFKSFVQLRELFMGGVCGCLGDCNVKGFRGDLILTEISNNSEYNIEDSAKLHKPSAEASSKTYISLF